MQLSSSTALIFFSRSAAAEAVSKPWLGTGRKRQNHAVARLLIAQAKASIQGSGLEIIAYDERLQRGKTFGERLANAFADVFARGYKAAIAVGNDSPQLGKTDWAALRAALESGQTILGPTHRGGAYLIGLQADEFDEAAMAALPWQSAATYKALHAYLGDAGKQPVRELAVLRELNTADDLHAYIRLHDDHFVHGLMAILSTRIAIPLPPRQQVHRHKVGGIAHRGPPQP